MTDKQIEGIGTTYPTLEELANEYKNKFDIACSCSTHIIEDRHDNYDGETERIGLTRIENDADIYITKKIGYCFDYEVIGKISQFEIRQVVEFLNNYETPMNLQTLDEELKLLRQMAGYVIHLSQFINAGLPNNTHSKYCPNRSLSMGIQYFAKEYRDRFGMP